MKKKVFIVALTGMLMFGMAGCKNGTSEEENDTRDKVTETMKKDEKTDQFDDTSITIFAAKSLRGVVDELIGMYQERQPNVNVVTSYDSSGTLMEQIKEGAACDLFFSAAQKQMDQLEQEKLLVNGTRANVVNNQVCLVTYKDSGTSVTGLANIADAKNLALADGSVPVGRYTRQALVNVKMLEEAADISAITTQEVSVALNGMEINECINVGAVTTAVAEGANEVGTVYRSDTYGFEDRLEILEILSYDLTGDVIYPIAQTVNDEADETQSQAARDFLRFLVSDEAKTVYEKYCFDVNVE